MMRAAPASTGALRLPREASTANAQGLGFRVSGLFPLLGSVMRRTTSPRALP